MKDRSEFVLIPNSRKDDKFYDTKQLLKHFFAFHFPDILFKKWENANGTDLPKVIQYNIEAVPVKCHLGDDNEIEIDNNFKTVNVVVTISCPRFDD